MYLINNYVIKQRSKQLQQTSYRRFIFIIKKKLIMPIFLIKNKANETIKKIDEKTINLNYLKFIPFYQLINHVYFIRLKSIFYPIVDVVKYAWNIMISTFF